MNVEFHRPLGSRPVGAAGNTPSPARFLGIDLGTETLKIVELIRTDRGFKLGRRRLIEHGKNPLPLLKDALRQWDWAGIHGVAVTGRLSRQLNLPQIPAQQALSRGYRTWFDSAPATLVSIGSHGFSVLEIRSGSREIYRENSRCSQGTGNFLRQLVERFSLTIEDASELCAGVEQSAPLSGRCPVILKTDMTHLANKGEDRARILAGLFDAVCENVMVLVKPGISPANVLLTGGVTRSRRVQDYFREALARHHMTLQPAAGEDALFLEALGCARLAAEVPAPPPSLDQLPAPAAGGSLDRLSALSGYLARVTRLPAQPLAYVNGDSRELVLGFDIGSTGSKAVALDLLSQQIVWEGYRQTLGAPVEAAQWLLKQYLQGPAHHCRLAGFGVTGSGREIVGSLLTTCYGKEAVYVLNEIAAHAAGACHFNPRVDTIFEIGGQDAKYIRLAEGRVIDCAMNEACSAGTGSFIEEQGKKFAGIRDVIHLGETALNAPGGVSLGQHCSVFMAEIIDEAVASGVAAESIIAGLYDSIIQNYLNRVKGTRSVGRVVFCQGMPFASDALAAAVARQTGSEVIVPPNPGTVGALGIALLSRRELAWQGRQPLDPVRFLGAKVDQKNTFVCKSVIGCGGAGNRCKIDALKTLVAGERRTFTWGGGCSLHDHGTRRKKLPDRAPDPFRERADWQREQLEGLNQPRGGPRIAMADEFMLKGLFPFFTTFLYECGFDLEVLAGADQSALKRGIQEANVPFCAPMQLFHGMARRMTETQADYLFLPMIRQLPRVQDEPHAVVCPIVQASPDVLRWDLGPAHERKILSPVVDVGPGNLASAQFVTSCRRLAEQLGVARRAWPAAFRKARAAQQQFEAHCLALGQRALDYCARHHIAPVVVLGRPYTIYNPILNSNVPAILREQGAIGIPVDCYPLKPEIPVFPGMYWGHGQRSLCAAHQIRRSPGVYSLYCSNYACGPDSFNLHFYSYIMEGRPLAIIETDGHSGDAGTKTRVEAFLHCVEQERRSATPALAPNDFQRLEPPPLGLRDLQPDEVVLVPHLGPGSEVVTACLQGARIPAESLPLPNREAVRLGRRYTSGKECLPMGLTLGNLLQRLERETDPQRRFVYLMPGTNGPCRFGVYNLLNRITLERLGWTDRLRIWSPKDAHYFAGMPPGFVMLVFAGFMASDLLLDALLTVRPTENEKGAAQRLYAHYRTALLALLETAARGDLSLPRSLWQIAGGRLFGVAQLLTEAADAFARIQQPATLPTVLLVGEMYVRCDDFANDFIAQKLESQGLRVRLAPVNEWVEYCDFISYQLGNQRGWSVRLASYLQQRIQDMTYQTMASRLHWPPRSTVHDLLHAAQPFLRPEMVGEAVLTIGGPAHEWREKRIDGVVSVGPLECMPNKIAEAQLYHVSEKHGLPSLTLPLNGDPVDSEIIHNFAFEVRTLFQRKPPAQSAGHPGVSPASPPGHFSPVLLRARTASATELQEVER